MSEKARDIVMERISVDKSALLRHDEAARYLGRHLLFLLRGELRTYRWRNDDRYNRNDLERIIAMVKDTVDTKMPQGD